MGLRASLVGSETIQTQTLRQTQGRYGGGDPVPAEKAVLSKRQDARGRMQEAGGGQNLGAHEMSLISPRQAGKGVAYTSRASSYVFRRIG